MKWSLVKCIMRAVDFACSAIRFGRLDGNYKTALLIAAIKARLQVIGRESWSFEETLAEALAVEIASRSDSSVRHRLREARFPDLKTLDQFDFTTAEGIDQALVAKLSRGDWLERKDNIILAGPVGTGKTHLAIAVGIEDAKQRRRVAFLRAADLVRQLIEARDTRELGRLTRRFDRLDLLILDEVGFVPFHRDGGELLFNLIAHRYERRSLIVTKGRSYRMRRRQAQPDPQAAAETGEDTKPKKR